jgi:hypothetical protein
MVASASAAGIARVLKKFFEEDGRDSVTTMDVAKALHLDAHITVANILANHQIDVDKELQALGYQFLSYAESKPDRAHYVTIQPLPPPPPEE